MTTKTTQYPVQPIVAGNGYVYPHDCVTDWQGINMLAGSIASARKIVRERGYKVMIVGGFGYLDTTGDDPVWVVSVHPSKTY